MKSTSIINQHIRIISLLMLIGVIYTPDVFSQSVTILPGGISPNQGGAVPRLSNDAIMALTNPQNGDMAYDITFNCLRLYKKNKWVKVMTDAEFANPSMIGWQIGGAKYDQASAVATDAGGNVYVAGYFQESALFENTEVTGNGATDINLYIAKYTSTGHLLWVQKMGYSPSAFVYDLLVDTSGNIYVTGYFYASAAFGANTLTSAGVKDIFLAKYNSSGTLQWIQQAGGTLDDEARSLCVDSNGNVYITGTINGNVTFGGTNQPGSGYHVFMAKYKNDGTFQWMRRGGSGNNNTANGIAVDANGKVTMIGYFQGSAMFSEGMIGSAGQIDIFLVQYDSNGALAWARSMGGSGKDYGIDVAVDASNNLIIFGSFEGAAGFGGYSMTSAGLNDVFIAKLNSAGFTEWVKRDGGTDFEQGRSMALDSDGNIYITGDFVKTSTFGNTILHGLGVTDVYMAKYNTNGKLQWAEAIESENSKTVYKIATDTKGNIYGAGYFSVEFSTDDTIFTTRGAYDGFVMRLRD